MQYNHIAIRAEEVLAYTSRDGDVTTDVEELSEVRVVYNENGAATHRCSDCGRQVTEYADVWRDTDGNTACTDTDGMHNPFPEPLAWVKYAAILPDPDEDTLTVTITIGTPAVAFAMTVRRHKGQVYLDVPHPEEFGEHPRLTGTWRGTYKVGT